MVSVRNNIFKVILPVVGAIFVASGIIKLTDLSTFHSIIQSYDVIPFELINIVVVTIPSLEVICGIMLVVGIFKKTTSLIICVLLGIFTALIGYNLLRGNVIECGCMVPLIYIKEISIGKIIFNLVMLLTLLSTIYCDTSGRSLYKDMPMIGILVLLASLLVNIHYRNNNLKNYIKGLSINIVDLETAFDLLDNKGAILFDARSNNEYSEGHITNALSLPANDIISHYNDYHSLKDTAPILIYCGNKSCKAAEIVAQALVNRGWANISIIDGGYENWKRLKQ